MASNLMAVCRKCLELVQSTPVDYRIECGFKALCIKKRHRMRKLICALIIKSIGHRSRTESLPGTDFIGRINRLLEAAQCIRINSQHEAFTITVSCV